MEPIMTIYNVVDQQNREFGTFTSREKAVDMASLLKNWFADRNFHVEEFHIEPVDAA
jgi:hypothetical protein